MREPQPLISDALSNLDERLAGELLVLLRALSDAIEQHYAGVLARQKQRDWESRQSPLWPDDDPPF
jgi:hypothetical protein